MTASALLAGLVASTGLGTLPAAALAAPNGIGALAIAPGTVFAANPGVAGGGTGPGYITIYRPGASGNTRPEGKITAGISDPAALAFDPAGDLWVSNETSATVVEYNRAELTKASPVPTITISADASGDFSDPWGVVFGPSGDMWLADNGTSSLMEFTKAELAKSGSPAPRVTIYSDILNGPCAPALDSSGDLWTGNYNLNNVVEFTRAQLTKSGSPVPRVTISSNSLVNACRPVFDSAGDLWVGSWGANDVVEFTKAELARSGSAVPKVVITATGFFAAFGDVALDAAGNLWVPNAANGGSVVEYAKSELAKSGSPAAARSIAGRATGLDGDWAVAVEP